MKKPKIFADSGWSQSWIELVVLFALTTVAATLLLDMHWLVGITVAPFIMLATLATLLIFVQMLWILVVGMDRLGAAVGLRKSPLA